MQVVFEPEDKPQFNPSKAIDTARKVMQGFSPDDYLLWAGGGDPIAVMVACMIAAEESEEVKLKSEIQRRPLASAHADFGWGWHHWSR